MPTATVNKKENLLGKESETNESILEKDAPRPLSQKAQEAKIFLERNPIPKEFLKKK